MKSRRAAVSRAPRPALVAALALLAAGSISGNASAEDSALRERFVTDRDAAALLTRLASSPDPADRAWMPLARLAADPAARADAAPAPGEGGSLAAVVDALRLMDLSRAKGALEAAARSGRTPILAWVEALVLARAGRDDEAIRRVAESPPIDPRAHGFPFAVVGAALPRDDRELLAAVVRRAVIRAASVGRLGDVSALAEGAALLCPGCAGRVVVAAVRALRRGGRDGEAAALLSSGAAARAGGAGTAEALAIERAIVAWRRGDGARARAEAASVRAPTSLTWAFEALARASAAPALVAASPLLVVEADADGDAAGLARLLVVVSAGARTDDLAARAAGRSTTCADGQFVADVLAGVGATGIDLVGDAGVARDALTRGLPVVVRRIRRVGDRFVEVPVVARGFDAATDLVVLDECDADRVDVMPAAELSKSRLLLVVPRARAAEAGRFRDVEAARLGTALSQDLVPVAKGQFDRVAESLLARSNAMAATSPAPTAEARAVIDLYAGWVQFASTTASVTPALAAADVAARRASAGALLRRSSATPPVLAVERYVRTSDGSAGRDEAGAVAADLAAVDLLEGPQSYVHATRFIVLEGARRHTDAIAAVALARELDPFDVRTLYFRGSARRILGDTPGAKDDLVRVLDRRPDTLAAAEDLAQLYLDAGAADRALAVVEALVTADPKAATSVRVRQLRQRTEIRNVRRARSAADLVPLSRSPEPDTRKEVAWTAASFETPEAEALLSTLLVDPDEGVRRKAAQAFQRPWLADRAGADAPLFARLVRACSSDVSAAVREAVAIALSRVESAASDATLAERLVGSKRDADAGVRAAVAEAFTGRDTPAVRRALVSSLLDDASVVRTAAILALRRLAGSANGYEPDDPPDRRASAVRAWEAWLASGR